MKDKKQPPAFRYHDFDAVKNIALRFPGAEEGVSHEGTPSVKVGGKLMCRLHDTGAFIPIRLDFSLRDRYLDSHPEVFHLPDHFKAYPYLCMWVDAFEKKLLTEVLTLSWKGLATKKLLQEYEARTAAGK